MYTPFKALAIVSSDGVALPKIRGMWLYFFLNSAQSLAWYLGVVSCLYVSLCSSSIIIIPKLVSGVNIALRVPITIWTSSLNIFKYSSYFSPADKPLWNIATSLPNLL